MNKPWLRADAAWSGEREPGGYLHGPWPKFWVEPERRVEFARASDARRMAWAWRRYTEAGLRDGPPLGPARYHELRYESLIREPAAEAERILDFLGIRDQASRAAFITACQRADGASLGSWRTAFYPSEVADIESEAGDLLGRLGYDGLSPPGRLERVGFLHLGRPESGVRRYGQLIADEAASRPGLTILQADAGRLDEQAERLADVGRELADTQVVILQWNRRGWGTRGRSLARLMRFRRAYRGALVVTLHDVFGRHGVRERWLNRTPGACAHSGGRRTGSSSTRRSRWSGCAGSCPSTGCASSRTSSSVGRCRSARTRHARGWASPTAGS